jgi:hypothetical protein
VLQKNVKIKLTVRVKKDEVIQSAREERLLLKVPKVDATHGRTYN